MGDSFSNIFVFVKIRLDLTSVADVRMRGALTKERRQLEFLEVIIHGSLRIFLFVRHEVIILTPRL